MECALDMSPPHCARKSNIQRLLAGFAFGACAQGRFRSNPDAPQTTVPLEQYARLPSCSWMPSPCHFAVSAGVSA